MMESVIAMCKVIMLYTISVQFNRTVYILA